MMAHDSKIPTEKEPIRTLSFGGSVKYGLEVLSSQKHLAFEVYQLFFVSVSKSGKIFRDQDNF